MEINEIIRNFEITGSLRNIEGMARFGIKPKTKVYGVPVPGLRKMARQIGKNQEAAIELWKTKIHEARILASMVAEPEKITDELFEEWVGDFDSWDLCDQACMNLLDKTKIGYKKIFEFAKRDEEFVKRCAFSLIAAMASHRKDLNDRDFIKFFPVIKKAAIDERNFVKKAVNWALRGIGKRNKSLNKHAIALAEEIKKINSKAAKWIAGDALRELKNEKIQSKLKTA